MFANGLIVLLLIVGGANAVCLAAGETTTRPSQSPSARDAFTSEAPAILGIRQGKTDILPMVAEVGQHLANGELAEAEQTTDQLADLIVSGHADLAGYRRALFDNWHISNKACDETLPASANWIARVQVLKFIWNRALSESDPEKASRLARALVALTLCDTIPGESLMRIWMSVKWETFKKVSGLTPAELDRLQALYRASARLSGKYGTNSWPMLRAVDKVVVLPKGEEIPDELSDAAIAALRDRRAFIGNDLFHDHQLITQTWMLKNLGVARNSQKTVAAAMSLLEQWKSEIAGSGLTQEIWLNEAITRIGEPRDRPQLIEPGNPRYQLGLQRLGLLGKVATQPSPDASK